MKKSLLLFAFMGTLLSCGKSGNSPEEKKKPEIKAGPTVTVMTYNTFGARPSVSLPPSDLPALAAIIKRADPDLVALQEIDKNTRRSGVTVDQAKTLASLTGMYYFFVKAIDRDGGDYGDAILSRWPIKDPKGYILTTTPQLGGELRSVARITVELEGKQFYFISTHLDHLGDESNRIHQANELNALLKTFDKPVILGGDLNAIPSSATIDILKKQLILGCPNNNCQPTFPTPKADRTIDYIMYAPLNAMKVLDYKVYDYASIESDHYPVIARFEIK